MLNDFLQIHSLIVVFVGEFNPVIIQPFWLASKKLIREQEAQTANIEIIHREIVRFSLDWVHIEVTTNRLELRSTQEPYFEPLKDLAISIFEVLSETPLRAVGINNLKYFALPDKERYYHFGNKLAPLDNWSGSLKDPRLMTVEILEQKRADGLEGNYRVRVQPSDIKLSTEFGVLINTNDHLQISAESTGRNGEVIKLFGDNWTSSQKRSSDIVEDIWKKINN